ncbi:acetyl-CoA carboxylase biotin carboxylase subunit family protein [Streptomyces sp. NPDC057430]|uniref:ATP-grasp domain-containing protein n=1 Tax=Streptomyces sp. NPDC057430 TaxID=3346131 RepID=UPI0036AF458A
MPTVLLFSRQPLRGRPLQQWLDHPRDVVLITTPKAVDGAEDILAASFPRHRLVDDYHGWATEEVAEAAAREYGVDLVASTSESDVLRAARLRARLGLPGQDVASATAYRDKVVMKELARAAGVRVPAFAAVDSPQDLLDFVDAHGLPVVVKPRAGAGAEGVAFLRERADITAFFTRERGSEVPYLPGQWMVESLAHGAFHHVDGIMRDGRIVHSWPARYTGGLAERVRENLHAGSTLLAPDDAVTHALQRMAADVVAALPPAPHPLAFHLEAWLGPDGVPVLCEIASRAGGSLIGDQYIRAFGVHLAREGLRAQCGLPLTLTTQPAAPSRAIGHVLLPPGHGVFVPPAVPCPVPGVELTLMREPGAHCRGVENAADAAASVFAEADTTDAVESRLADAMEWWNQNTRWD